MVFLGTPCRSLRWSWGQHLMASVLPSALYVSFFEGMVDDSDDWGFESSSRGASESWTTVGRGGRAEKKKDLLQVGDVRM
jgi:hypothetical protein